MVEHSDFTTIKGVYMATACFTHASRSCMSNTQSYGAQWLFVVPFSGFIAIFILATGKHMIDAFKLLQGIQLSMSSSPPYAAGSQTARIILQPMLC